MCCLIDRNTGDSDRENRGLHTNFSEQRIDKRMEKDDAERVKLKWCWKREYGAKLVLLTARS